MSPVSSERPLAEVLRRAREDKAYGPLAAAVPYARFLGIALEEHEGEVLCHMRYAPMLIGNPLLPALHGGTLGGLLETAAYFEVLLRTQEEQVPKLISLTVDFLRSGKPRDTLARATVKRQGRRVAHVHVEAWQEDRSRPIASAKALLLLSH